MVHVIVYNVNFGEKRYKIVRIRKSYRAFTVIINVINEKGKSEPY